MNQLLALIGASSTNGEPSLSGDVTEEQEEDDDNQDRPFDQVLLDRGDGLVHQIGAVSYTHLDVYKRQTLILVGRVLDPGAFAESALYDATHRHLFRPGTH